MLLSPSFPQYTHGKLSYTVWIAWSNYIPWSLHNNCHEEAVRNSSSPVLYEVLSFLLFPQHMRKVKSYSLTTLMFYSLSSQGLGVHLFPLAADLWKSDLPTLCFFSLCFYNIWKVFFLVQMNTNITATGLVIFQGAKWEILTSMCLFHIY